MKPSIPQTKVFVELERAALNFLELASKTNPKSFAAALSEGRSKKTQLCKTRLFENYRLVGRLPHGSDIS